MSLYHIIVETKDEKSNAGILKSLEGLQKQFNFKIDAHEHEDDPAEEAGEYILWYMSESHKQVRYFVAPPPGMGMKPVWSYKKKDAAKLSETACKLTASRIAMMGYTTPLKIDKGGPDLTVVSINGNASAEENLEVVVESAKEESPAAGEVMEDMIEHGPFYKGEDETPEEG
jgi:hypothetical protein